MEKNYRTKHFTRRTIKESINRISVWTIRMILTWRVRSVSAVIECILGHQNALSRAEKVVEKEKRQYCASICQKSINKFG